MKIAVLVKQVPDTETKIKIKPDASGIEETGIKFVMSPYDEFAVEEAIKIKEKNPGTETVVVALGPDRVVDAMRTALAMGVDKAIHVNTEGQTLDSFAAANVLANVLKAQNADLILCGKQAIDQDNSQVPQMIAELLDVPQTMIVEKVELGADQKSLTATRRVSGGAKETYELALPAVLGCEKGLNTPRYASLPGIMKAKSKPVEKLKAADFLNGASSLVQFANYQLPPERAAGKKLQGEPADQARELVRLLREEAKAI